jgi:hypothetical protein
VKKRKRRRNGNVPPSYTESHWGIKPTVSKDWNVHEPSDNDELIGLGTVVSIVYLTEKGGDGELVEYEHDFSPRNPPLLAYGDRDGKLYIVAGSYKVTKHGIVG